MAITNLRENIALAFDGGGVRGIIPATALSALEAALGVKRLIDAPQIKVITGTSTGAIIAAAVALGMTSAEIVKLYREMAPIIFPRKVEIPASWRDTLDKINKVFSLPDNTGYVEHLREIIRQRTGNPDITLGELHQQTLHAAGKVLLITTVNVYERRTRFLKSCTTKNKADPDSDQNWGLWEAVVASSAAPTFFPVYVRQRFDDHGRIIKGEESYYIDGGTGSFNNPAYIAAREALEFQCYPRETVSVLSFGTGWLDQMDFEESEPTPPDKWNILEWAAKVPLDIMMSEAARVQSLDVLHDFVVYHSGANKFSYDAQHSVDFRRFQIRLDRKIDLDDSSAESLVDLQRMGTDLLANIRANHYLTSENIIDIATMPNTRDFIEEADRKDPEGITQLWRKIMAAGCS